MEIVKLIGEDVLPDDQKLTMEIARVIRVGFLQQNAFHADDTYVPLEKQLKMMQLILHLHEGCKLLVQKNIPISQIVSTGQFAKLIKVKYDIPNSALELFDDYLADIDQSLKTLEEAQIAAQALHDDQETGQ